MKRAIVSVVAGVFVLSAADMVLGFGGANHWHAGRMATWLFWNGVGDPAVISSDHGSWPIYPELNEYSYSWDYRASYQPGDPEDRTFYNLNWEYVMWGSQCADDACPATLNHFLLLSDGLDDDPGYSTNNSWEVSYNLWLQALQAWNDGDLGWAYTNLGYCMHHVQDMLQPAHSNDDLHPGDGLDAGDDAIEEWFTDDAATALYSWDGSSGPPPGDNIPWPTGLWRDNADILQDIRNAGIENVDDFPALTEPSLPYNMQKYFYLLYWANQFGSWFASDDIDGSAYDPCGWMNGYPGFPRYFNDGYDIWDANGLDNNDTDCDDCTDHCRGDECDADYDLTLISTWCYGGVFKVCPVLVDLFRRTVDSQPPVTTVEVTRADGEDVVEWNNSPVTVALTGATDEANPCFRPSGVWKVWGECDDQLPADYNAPSWVISEDGKHLVECMSTDWCGNVEHGNEIDVWVDMTPPEVTFPDLRPNYLTSEDFIATWSAYDETSGVASEMAYLDGELVEKGQVIDLALLAGVHTLRVIVSDRATNWTDVEFTFEVFIDATSWAKPINLGDKTKGTGMYCGVEFPAPYDVGQINMSTCALIVKGTIDLNYSNPVVGGTGLLVAENITGVGDVNSNGIPDRMLRFNKEKFVAALFGQTGNVPSVVRGGLGPDGMPRFLAPVTVPVFAPPKKK